VGDDPDLFSAAFAPCHVSLKSVVLFLCSVGFQPGVLGTGGMGTARPSVPSAWGLRALRAGRGRGEAGGRAVGRRGTASPAPSAAHGTIPRFLRGRRPHCPAETGSDAARKGLRGSLRIFHF